MATDVTGWLAEVWPEHPWDAARTAHGAFHRVAVLPDVVARVVSGS